MCTRCGGVRQCGRVSGVRVVVVVVGVALDGGGEWYVSENWTGGAWWLRLIEIEVLLVAVVDEVLIRRRVVFRIRDF